jgi:2-aminoadipate transaminase
MYADRINGIKSSAIRDILKLTARPGMISLAGGLPAPEMFPLDALRTATMQVLSRYGSHALQYSITEGLVPLREKIVRKLDGDTPRCSIDNVIITQGSQQALELLSKLFLDKGSIVFTENPSYLGALQAFRLFQADIIAIPSDEHGIRTDALRDALRRQKPAFLYVMTNFQNPTGVSLSLDRRRELLQIAKEHDLLVVEDDPYGELVFEGEKLPSLYSLGRGENVVYLSTFSKTIAPGLRIAYAVGSHEVIGKLALAKQGTDLQTNTFGQYIVNEYLESGRHQDHIDLIRRTYGARRDRMLSAMKAHLPGTVTWNRPRGGMFLWLAFPPETDTKDLLLRCIEHNVAFVPGQEFFPDGSGSNTARLNFSNASLENIEEGIRRIGAVLQETPGQTAEQPEMLL